MTPAERCERLIQKSKKSLTTVQKGLILAATAIVIVLMVKVFVPLMVYESRIVVVDKPVIRVISETNFCK